MVQIEHVSKLLFSSNLLIGNMLLYPLADVHQQPPYFFIQIINASLQKASNETI